MYGYIRSHSSAFATASRVESVTRATEQRAYSSDLRVRIAEGRGTGSEGCTGLMSRAALSAGLSLVADCPMSCSIASAVMNRRQPMMTLAN
jgi:hypothetical protein